jgi:hypothetical protein
MFKQFMIREKQDMQEEQILNNANVNWANVIYALYGKHKHRMKPLYNGITFIDILPCNHASNPWQHMASM